MHISHEPGPTTTFRKPLPTVSVIGCEFAIKGQNLGSEFRQRIFVERSLRTDFVQFLKASPSATE